MPCTHRKKKGRETQIGEREHVTNGVVIVKPTVHSCIYPRCTDKEEMEWKKRREQLIRLNWCSMHCVTVLTAKFSSSCKPYHTPSTQKLWSEIIVRKLFCHLGCFCLIQFTYSNSPCRTFLQHLKCNIHLAFRTIRTTARWAFLKKGWPELKILAHFSFSSFGIFARQSILGPILCVKAPVSAGKLTQRYHKSLPKVSTKSMRNSAINS